VSPCLHRRFCSHLAVLESFVHNVDLMRRIVASDTFKSCIGNLSEKDKVKADKCVRTWTAECWPLRAKRAASVLKPVCVFCRVAGIGDFSQGLSAWNTMKIAVSAAMRKSDFKEKDNHKKLKETDEDVQIRHEAVLKAVDSRGSKWVTDAHCAAHILDPRERARAVATGLCAAETVGYDVPATWASARVRCHKFLQGFFKEPAELEEAVKDLDNYLAGTGEWSLVAWPSLTATTTDIVIFWQSRQPSHLLSRLAIHLFSMRLSQGCAEREWATLARQCQPIRNHLRADTKAGLWGEVL